MDPIRQFATGILLMAFTVGLVVIWLVLLNARDRRTAAALQAVAGRLPADLQGLIAIQVSSGLFSRACRVHLDTWALCGEEVLRVFDRLAGALPANLHLTATGASCARPPVPFTIQWDGGPAYPSARRSLALG